MVEHTLGRQGLLADGQTGAWTFTARSVRRRRIVTILLATDLVLLLASGALATVLDYFLRPSAIHTPWEYAALSCGFAVVCLATIAFDRLYDVDRVSWGSGELSRMVWALATGAVAFVIITFLLQVVQPPRAWTVMSWLIASLLLVAGRITFHAFAQRARCHRSWLQQPTLVVGSNVEAAEVARILIADPGSGLIPVGSLATSLKDRLSLDFVQPQLPSMGSARDLVDVVENEGIDTVVIVASAFDYEVLQRMLVELKDLPVTVHLSSGLTDVLTSRVLVREISGIPVISLKGLAISRTNIAIKRAFDIVVGGLMVVIGMPVWLLLAAAIKLTSRGPVLYEQERVGKRGVPFQMYKFRSMVAGADRMLDDLEACNEATGPLFKMKRDPRVTPLGRWMRKFSIDEFPQLLNVLKGEMSLVGPRPPLASETIAYGEEQWRRLAVSPGMTGMWQVSGRSTLTFEEMVRLDQYYIDNWSLGLDVTLLLRTIPTVLTSKGAY